MVFETESAASAFLSQHLSPYFHLVPEVWMSHCDGTSVRIDFAAVPRSTFHVPWFGIEVKRGYDGYNEWTEALRQAVDYRHSKLVDKRSLKYRGQCPPWVFVWPDIRDGHDSAVYERWAEGTERSHGKLKVGTIRLAERFGGTQIEFRMSASPVWRPTQGAISGNIFGTWAGVGAR